MLEPISSLPMQGAREALKGRGLAKDDQEALLVIAALIANHAYGPSEIHPELIHSSWYDRVEEIWRTPPGFRHRVFEKILQVEYGRTAYIRTYHEAMQDALAAFHPREVPNM